MCEQTSSSTSAFWAFYSLGMRHPKSRLYEPPDRGAKEGQDLCDLSQKVGIPFVHDQFEYYGGSHPQCPVAG
eukprot:79849-Pelagomonas_calceolata.AAC.6